MSRVSSTAGMPGRGPAVVLPRHAPPDEARIAMTSKKTVRRKKNNVPPPLCTGSARPGIGSGTQLVDVAVLEDPLRRAAEGGADHGPADALGGRHMARDERLQERVKGTHHGVEEPIGGRARGDAVERLYE